MDPALSGSDSPTLCSACQAASPAAGELCQRIHAILSDSRLNKGDAGKPYPDSDAYRIPALIEEFTPEERP